MKVTFQTQDLCRALERVQRAAQTKVTSNTNNGFFISAEDGKVEFQANDYSIGIRTFCEADVEERGIRPYFGTPSFVYHKNDAFRSGCYGTEKRRKYCFL